VFFNNLGGWGVEVKEKLLIYYTKDNKKVFIEKKFLNDNKICKMLILFSRKKMAE